MKESYTRQGRKQWQIDLDSRGIIRSDWAEKFATGAICSSWNKYFPHIEEFDWRADFVSRELGLIWAAAFELSDEGLPVDMVSISQKMSENETLGDLPDGMQFLIELMDQTEDFADATHFSEWLKIISRQASLRRFLEGTKSVLNAADRNHDLESMRSAMSKLLDAVPETPNKREMMLVDAIAVQLDKIEAGVDDTLKVTVPEIDMLTGGFAPTELVVLAARPGHGKTMIVSQMVDAAAHHGHTCMIVSEEMSIDSLAKRSIPRIASFEKAQWREEINRLRFEVREHFAGCAPIIVREFSVTIDRVERAVASAVSKHGIRFCAVDYAQLIKAKGASRYEQISEVSTRMKQLANRHNITVFLLAQLSRAIDTREGFIPIMSDLKDTGQLEQDADVILAGVWPVKFDEKYEDPHEYRIHHLKNRNRGVFVPVARLRIDPIRQRLRGTIDYAADNF